MSHETDPARGQVRFPAGTWVPAFMGPWRIKISHIEEGGFDMPITCSLGFHDWGGCTCRKCGKVRDQDHNWSEDCERCARCGAERKGFHDWNGCLCSTCGKTGDEGHDWSEDCEKCARCGAGRKGSHDWFKDCEKCAACGATRQGTHSWDGCRCSLCGMIRDEGHDWSESDTRCSRCGKEREAVAKPQATANQDAGKKATMTKARLIHHWETDSIINLGVVISSDGRSALTYGEQKHIQVWNLPDGTTGKRLEGHDSNVASAAFSRDGLQVLSGSDSGEIRLWNIEKGTSVELQKGHGQRVSSVAFLPDEKRAMSASWDKTVRLWDLSSLSCIHVFEGHRLEVTDVAVSPDGQLAVSVGFDAAPRVWNLVTRQCEAELPVHNDKVLCVSISGNGRRLISGGMDGLLAVSDLPVTELQTLGPLRSGISDLVLSTDGEEAFISMLNGMLWLVDLKTNAVTQLFQMQGKLPTEAPVSLRFDISGDGRYIIGGRAGIVALFEVEKDGA